MALTLHQSNRIEYLAKILAMLMRPIPLQDVFAPEEILVTAAGVRRFVDLNLARDMGVAANIRYDNIAVFFWRIMFACLPDVPQENVYAPPVLRWRILDTLMSGALPEVQAALGTYREAYDTADDELAQELARLLDQYLVYRPQWTETWSAGQRVNLGANKAWQADEAWQASLWRHLRAQIDTPHRVALWQELRTFLSQKTLPPRVHLPERVFVFGISTLAPVYLGLLEALSRHCNVHVLALNPCEKHWGEILSAAQQLRAQNEVTAQDEVTAQNEVTAQDNPLLASWGKQGRDFFDMLSELNPVGGRSLFDGEPKTPTLLQRIQHDIQTLNAPQQGCAEADDSIMLVSTYSPLRELQAVKDALLNFLSTHPDCSPDDVAVLSPDIEQYAPFIEAVFGRAAPDGVALPYSIADTKISRGEPFLQAWAMLLTLFASRFEINTLLPLLDNECVLRRFALSRDDVPLLQHVLRETCVRWAWDEAERARAGATEAVFTWSQALDRVVAGLLLPAGEELWQGIATFASDIELLPVLSRCVDLLQTLAAARDTWQNAAGVDEWAARINHIGTALLDGQGSPAATTFAAQVQTWQNECAHARFPQTLTAATVGGHIQRWLSAPAEAGFLRGGVTFGSMVPLRNLPFAFLALIGMNDDAFPRANRHAPFDLMAAYPQKGDRSRRDDDRYLFLESVMSARKVLYLSYVGRDIHDNEARAPSELIHELGDSLAVMTGGGGDYWADHLRQQPLQAFSPRHFGTPPRSYRADYAAALNAPREDSPPFFDSDTNNNAIVPTSVAWTDFVRFWRNPPRTWLQHKLSWRSVYRDDTWDDAEPFAVTDTEAVNLAYLHARRNGTDFKQVDALLSAQSRYPAACFGDIERETYRSGVLAMDAALFAARALPPQAFALTLENGITLHGNLTELTESGQIFFRGGTPNAPQRITDYLTHLCACALCDPPPTTIIACPAATATLPPLPADEARAHLLAWCDAYILGQNRPLPFFARTSLAAAQTLYDKQNIPDAHDAAHKAWFGNNQKRGQCDAAEVQAVFGRDEQAPIDTEPFWHWVKTLLLPLIAISAQPDSAEKKEGNHEVV